LRAVSIRAGSAGRARRPDVLVVDFDPETLLVHDGVRRSSHDESRRGSELSSRRRFVLGRAATRRTNGERQREEVWAAVHSRRLSAAPGAAEASGFVGPHITHLRQG
jgi:hypothetical protein